MNPELETPNSELGTGNSQPETQNSEQKNWPRLYSIVIGELVVLVVVFYFFMKFFS